MMNATTGTVYLIGAGPGDPGLITLRGVECLGRADIVLYDYLVNAQILEHAPPSSERICLGRHGAKIWSQPEINQRMVDESRQGKTVARLKGGDPMVFGRAAEELQALLDHGVAFEVVPGITTALAAASYAGIPFTHRDLSSAVALVTGQEATDKPQSSIDFEALARFPGTLVIYMGITTSRRWTSQLIQAGMPPETTVALIRRCSWPDQQIMHCRLDDVADRVTPYSKFPPPAIAVVGAVSSLTDSLSWFQRRPLFGRTVMVTRPLHQSAELSAAFSELGAHVVCQPAITISDPLDWTPVDDALGRLSEFDYLVFSSSNGVRQLVKRLLKVGLDLRALGNLKIAAIGPGTADALREYHLHVDRQPSRDYRAESLVETLAGEAQGRRFLLARANRGREVLADGLSDAGAHIEQVVVYSSRDTEQPDPALSDQLDAGRVQWITVTSSAIAESLVKLFGDRLSKSRLVSISPITSATLRKLGFTPDVEATTYSMDGIVQAILQDSAD